MTRWQVGSGHLVNSYAAPNVLTCMRLTFFGRVALRAGLVVVGRVCLPFLIAFQIWSFELPSPLHELEGHTGCVRCSAFSLDGILLATGDDNGEIRVGVPTAIASLL